MSARDGAGRAGERIARLLQLQFGGYFMCRIATDPDPTHEERGISGYTMALSTEPRLDQVIRLQPGPQTVLREPAQQMGIEIGVKVTGVMLEGQPYAPAEAVLKGAPVELVGKAEPFDGPIFDSRNNITGSDDNMMFVVNPFHLVIRGKSGVTVDAVDHLNPAKPEQPIWEIEDPSVYARRLPAQFSGSSNQVLAILRTFDPYTYFMDRLRFLRHRIAELEAQRKPKKRDEALETRIEELRTRIYQIEFWGDRVFNKLGFQLTYDFRVNGPQAVKDRRNLLKGTVDTAHPWPVTFWFGGWDGDLLVGMMQGTLSIPFRPDDTGAA